MAALRSWQSVLAVVGAVTGVVGAVAAVAVFFLPTADGRQSSRVNATSSESPDGAGSARGAESVGGGATPSMTPAVPADVRRLAELPPSTGVGSMRVEGGDLVVPCPGNQSYDRYRELRFELVAPYRRLESGVGVSGPGDPDATAAVQVFVQRRQDRSDRVVEVGRSVVHRGDAGRLAVALDDAAALVLRVTCAATTQTVRLGAPRLTR
jgi:hypothetical protein